MVVASSLLAGPALSQSIEAPPITVRFPADIDTGNEEFIAEVSGLPRSEELISAIKEYQQEYIEAQIDPQATCWVQGSGGSGGWNVGGGCSWTFDASRTVSSASEIDGAEFLRISGDIGKKVFDMMSPDSTSSFPVTFPLTGACHVQKDRFRTCFNNFTPAMCESVKRQTGGIVEFVPFHKCP